MATRPVSPSRPDRRQRHVDMGLSALMVLQGFTLFLAIPLGSGGAASRMLLDACHLTFAVVCIGVLTRHRAIQAALLAIVALLVSGPVLAAQLHADLNIGGTAQHAVIAGVAFAFNAVVTALVARHVFGPGPVTAHRVRGAILLYLNVAALFAIADDAVAMTVAGAYAAAGSAGPATRLAIGPAAFSYFSLATITTTGYGDIVPVHPLARSLANLEAVFGQLFPATLLTRLVTLHLAGEKAPAHPSDAAHATDAAVAPAAGPG